MRTNRQFIYAPVLVVHLGLVVFGNGAGLAQAEVPTTAPASMDLKSLTADVQSANKQLQEVLPSGTLGDPAKREAAAPAAIPLLKRIESDFDGIVAAKPAAQRQVAGAQLQALAMLSCLGDAPSTGALRSMTDSSDSRQKLRGQSGQLRARWYAADCNTADQAGIVDGISQLDHANPDDNSLTLMTLDMSRTAATPELRDRLQSLVSNGMTSPVAVALKRQQAAAAAHQAEVASTLGKLVEKPIIVSGTMPDGSPFSTSACKGKVVLVDFWATWCGPCKAELPRVKQMYQQYHDQGLEVVGVSNDYDVSTLKSFIADQHMAWPELFDADAAADQQWSRVTLGFGIDSIPTMFLIDKKGIARSVTAREDMESLIPKFLAEPN